MEETKIKKKRKSLKQILKEQFKLRNSKHNDIPIIFGYLGLFLIIIGIINILPIFIMFIYNNEINRFLAFLIPGFLSILIGIPLSTLLNKRTYADLNKYNDIITLILIWLFACLISSIPFALPDYVGDFRIGGLGLNYFQALFECVSGYATTGLTMLNGNISSSLTPSYLLVNDGKCFLFFRSLLHFFGGVGFVLVLACIVKDNHGISLYYSEGHTDKILPNLYKTAKTIFIIYFSLVLVGAFALWLGGMNEWTKIDLPIGCENDPEYASFFEALCISMSACASGGFATRTLSLYAYNNLTIEIISIILMIFAATNFLTIYSFLTFKFKKVYYDNEIRTFWIFAIIILPIMILISLFAKPINNDLLSINNNLRYNFFYLFSSISTTGLSNSISITKTFSVSQLLIIIMLCSFGGHQGSTAGGIKLYRVSLTLKTIYYSIKEKNIPANILTPHYVYKYGEKRSVDQKELSDSLTYFLLYFTLLFFFALLISFTQNNDFILILFETSSAISSAGMSSGINYVNNNFALIILTIAMFIGRLEIYSFIYVLKKIKLDIIEYHKAFKKPS